jgi:hypothetical protein
MILESFLISLDRSSYLYYQIREFFLYRKRFVGSWKGMGGATGSWKRNPKFFSLTQESPNPAGEMCKKGEHVEE